MKKLLSLLLVVSFLLLPITVKAAEPLNPIEHGLQRNSSERVFDFPVTYNTNYDSIDIAGYQDWDFYERSMPDLVELQMDCDTVSFYAIGENGEIDETMIGHIEVWKAGDFTELPFPGDGSYTTIAWSFPKGIYRVYALGDPNIKKTHFMMVFSKFNDSILSISQPADLISYQAFLPKRKFVA